MNTHRSVTCSALGSAHTTISRENLSQKQASEDEDPKGIMELHKGFTFTYSSCFRILVSYSPRFFFPSFLTGRLGLPYTPITVAFQDLQYYVDTPLVMKSNPARNDTDRFCSF